MEEKKNPHFIWNYVVFDSLFFSFFKRKKKKIGNDFFLKTFCQTVIRKRKEEKEKKKESFNVEESMRVHLNYNFVFH